MKTEKLSEGGFKNSPFYKQIIFQYEQNKIFVHIFSILFFGIIFGSLVHSQEKKSNLSFKKGFRGIKDRHFIQHQILSIIRKEKTNLKIKKFSRINQQLMAKYSSLNL